MTEPEKPFFLRDELLEVLGDRDKVEAVCDLFAAFLRHQANTWHVVADMDRDVVYGRAAAIMCQGLADGIDRGKPEVTVQDPGVE